MNSLRNEWYRRELYESESEAYHRPMEKEYSFYSAVKNGDMEFVRKKEILPILREWAYYPRMH